MRRTQHPWSPSQRPDSWAQRLAPIAVLGLAACASPPPAVSVTQTIQVLVESEDPAWRGPLRCEASNDLGRWDFQAPGAVDVRSSTGALSIRCLGPDGSSPQTLVASGATSASPGGTGSSSEAGLKVGATVGGVLGLGLYPLLGPFALITAAAGAGSGALVGTYSGEAVGTLTAHANLRYAEVITLRVPAAPKAAPPSAPVPAQKSPAP